MHIKTFAGVYPNLARIRLSTTSFFNRVKETYPALRKAGYFSAIADAGCFVYRIEKSQRTYTGVIACLDILDYLEGRILKHERTLAAEEEKQLRLLLERRAAVKPVLMAYPNAAPLDAWIASHIQNHAPFLELTMDKEKNLHRLWKVGEAEGLQELTALFDAHVPRVYIADGHHRTTCSALLQQRLQEENSAISYDAFLCGLFPESELEILAFNRLAELPEDMDVAMLLQRLEEVCTLKLLKRKRRPRSKHEMTLFAGNDCYSACWKPAVIERYTGAPAILDTALLNDKILGDVLGIREVRTDRRISYIEGPKGWQALSRKTQANPRQVGFCLFPVSASEFFAVADAGATLPPKSTWFEPRMKNGLLVQEF